jgi:hypothetical protein
MKNIFRILPSILLSLLLLANTSRAEQVHYKSGSPSQVKQTAAGCTPGANFKWLEINNVRTRINTGGDMWWDFEVAQYEIPKGSKKMSMFSAALWIGGLDANGQLKLAANTYRYNGTTDYWTGPLTIDGTASVSNDVCAKWDKLHLITRAEVDDFNAWFDDKPGHPDYVIPESIKKYPAHGDIDKGQSYYMAPFFDRDNNGDYEPDNGDYPYYDISNELCHTKTLTAEDVYYNKEQTGNLVDQVLKGDATLWWVFNDKGNIHTASKGEPIGLEIRGQAFGFSTNDEINNMTFYSYEIINRSTYRLTETYFSQWVDTDLGFAGDDYVGCDVMRGLGYCYNGTAVDGSGQAWAYGNQPPAVGVDFFQGPYIDHDGNNKVNGDNPSAKGDPSFHLKGDTTQKFTGGAQLVQWDGDTIEKVIGTDTILKIVNSAAINGINFGNNIEDDERFGMRRFVYHNNTGVPDYMTDPDVAIQYYNYLKGIWKDNTKMVYGGNGHEGAGAIVPPIECDFMFPGTSDIYDWGTKGVTPNPKNWTEVTAMNAPSDRRFMESAGPFVLEPGAVNYITVGIPWAQAQTGGPLASVLMLQQVDDKCQQLFDNCFKVISGPNAPDLTIREMDKELILYITNRKTNDAGNNYQERYTEYDPRIQGPAGANWDSLYHFEGYQIFQLKNATVSVADLKNNELARLVFQCDVKNNVSRLINFNFDQSLGGSVPVEEVAGANAGIFHSVKLQKDIFTGADLINHKQYYYLALAYGQNNYKDYVQTDPSGLNGQKLPYLAGRKNIKTYTGIPHMPIGVVSAQSEYGEGVIVSRIAGQGNGGRYLELSDETVNEILSKKMVDTVSNFPGGSDYPIAYNITYKKGMSPIDVKVIDPLNVKNGNYTVKFDSMFTIHTKVGELDTVMDVTRWSLVDNSNGRVYQSDTTINIKNEQIFLDLGLSVAVEQQLYPGPYMVSKNIEGTPEYAIQLDKNGYLGSSIAYGDSLRQWINFLPDVDGVSQLDWIRAGVAATDWHNPVINFDPEGIYETVLPSYVNSLGELTATRPTSTTILFTGGSWTPYIFAASNDSIFSIAHRESPANDISKTKDFFADISGVDVVFTSDKSKWTRSVVIEESSVFSESEGKVKKHEVRAGRSVNQNGDTAVVSTDPALNSDFISPYGMGWFPGYAINVETGERLNIMFGEDSRLIEDNGRDMKFNPSYRLTTPFGKAVVGGRHYIYIMEHTKNKISYADLVNPAFDADVYDNPAYDGGAHFLKIMSAHYISPNTRVFAKALQFSNCMWTAIPFSSANPDIPWLDNDVKIELRISKPFARYFATQLTGEQNANNYWPMYTFNTDGVITDTNDVAKAKTDLDLINVVPNPYYAYSTYEANQLDNRVKIVNLPQRCTVTIYATNGNIIRQYNKDAAKTSIDWDLKNFAGIPISGGVYIIHVKTDQGEKIIKWFGSLRPVDLNAF